MLAGIRGNWPKSCTFPRQMESLPVEMVVSVREALSIVQTSLYLVRGRLEAAGAVDPYLDKHIARIEEGLARAILALSSCSRS